MAARRWPFPLPRMAAVLWLLLLPNCTPEEPTSPRLGAWQAAASGGPEPTVRATNPSASPRDTSISVQILGSGFDAGARAFWALKGDTAVATGNGPLRQRPRRWAGA